jgi:hypothetical protein
LRVLPRLSLGRTRLPWVVVMVVQIAAIVPGRDDRGPGFACAKAVGKSTCRGVGTNITARTPNACGRFGAGKQPSGKPGGARMKPSKPSTPRPSGRAVSALPLRRNHQSLPWLRRRVVTQQNFFPFFLCDRPGCYEPAPKSAGKPVRFCCPACRQAVRRVHDRERKWRRRGTFQGRHARQREYAAARVRQRSQQHDGSHAPPATPPP